MTVTAVIALTGACSSQQPGAPAPGGPSTATSGSSTASSSAVAPDRPAVLPLDSVQPCELVDEQTRQRFRIDRPDAPSATDPDAPVCTLMSSAGGGYVVAVERRKGIDALGREVNATVGGFPAVDIRQSGVKVGHLSIDVADGQRLDVEVQRLSGDQPIDEVYRDTMLLAESVLAVLRQKLGR